jgi:hypothetical protein
MGAVARMLMSVAGLRGAGGIGGGCTRAALLPNNRGAGVMVMNVGKGGFPDKQQGGPGQHGRDDTPQAEVPELPQHAQG